MNKLDTDYQNLLKDILKNGVQKSDRTGTGTISVFGRSIRHKMSDGFPLLTTKKMHTRGIATELLWFLRGDTDIRFLWDNDCNIWNGDWLKEYRKNNPDDHSISYIKNKIRYDDYYSEKSIWSLGPIYGSQWRAWNKDSDSGANKRVDQILELIHNLKVNPDSRRLLVTAWNPSDLSKQTLPPCHYGFQCYTRELSLIERRDASIDRGLRFNVDDTNKTAEEDYYNKNNIPRRALTLKWMQRSCDFPLGIPYNIASYGFLLEILSKKVNMIPDELIGDFGDCHIYTNQIDGVKEQLERTPYNLPKIKLNDDLDWFNEDLDSVISWMSSNISDWFDIINYKSHPAIKIPLSN